MTTHTLTDYVPAARRRRYLCSCGRAYRSRAAFRDHARAQGEPRTDAALRAKILADIRAHIAAPSSHYQQSASARDRKLAGREFRAAWDIARAEGFSEHAALRCWLDSLTEPNDERGLGTALRSDHETD